MRLHVGLEGFLVWEGFATGVTGRGVILLVRAPDMAVMSSMRGKRFSTILAFEGLLPGVLPDMRAEYTRGSEFLQTTESRGKNKIPSTCETKELISLWPILGGVQLQSCVRQFCNAMDCSLPGSSFPWDSPGRNTRMGCHFLFQGIFMTQGLNPHFLHWQADPLPLSHLRNPHWSWYHPLVLQSTNPGL